MQDLNIELIETPALITELARRFPNGVIIMDRQATPDDERGYIFAPSGDPWRCLYLAYRAAHILNLAIDANEHDNQNV